MEFKLNSTDAAYRLAYSRTLPHHGQYNVTTQRTIQAHNISSVTKNTENIEITYLTEILYSMVAILDRVVILFPVPYLPYATTGGVNWLQSGETFVVVDVKVVGC